MTLDQIKAVARARGGPCYAQRKKSRVEPPDCLEAGYDQLCPSCARYNAAMETLRVVLEDLADDLCDGCDVDFRMLVAEMEDRV